MASKDFSTPPTDMKRKASDSKMSSQQRKKLIRMNLPATLPPPSRFQANILALELNGFPTYIPEEYIFSSRNFTEALNAPPSTEGETTRDAINRIDTLHIKTASSGKYYDLMPETLISPPSTTNLILPADIRAEDLGTNDDFLVPTFSEAHQDIYADIEVVVKEIELLADNHIGSAIYNSIHKELTDNHPELSSNHIHLAQVEREIICSARHQLSDEDFGYSTTSEEQASSSSLPAETTQPKQYGPRPDAIAMQNAIQMLLTSNPAKQLALLKALDNHPIFRNIKYHDIPKAMYQWMQDMNGLARQKFIFNAKGNQGLCPTCNIHVHIGMNLMHNHCTAVRFLSHFKEYILTSDGIYVKKKRRLSNSTNPWKVFVASLSNKSPVFRLLDTSEKLIIRGYPQNQFTGEREAMTARRLSDSSNSSSMIDIK